MNEWMNECLATPQNKNSLAIGCQTNYQLYRNPSDKHLHKALKDINYIFQLAASTFWYMNGVL